MNHVITKPPTRFMVIYDGSCAFCERCRDWLAAEPTYVPLVFVRRDSHVAQQWLNQIFDDSDPAEMNVVDSEGRFYRGPAAWIACLWATRRYREWSYALARPRYRRGLKHAIELLARHRTSLSFVFGRSKPAWEKVEREARRQPWENPVACSSDACNPSRPPAPHAKAVAQGLPYPHEPSL